MLEFLRGRESQGEDPERVVLIGDRNRREYVKYLLKDGTRIVAELASGKHTGSLAGLAPEVVVLDCASEGVNPLLILPRLDSWSKPWRVVALTGGSNRAEEEALLDLGADALADERDLATVVRAIRPGESERAPEPPKVAA